MGTDTPSAAPAPSAPESALQALKNMKPGQTVEDALQALVKSMDPADARTLDAQLQKEANDARLLAAEKEKEYVSATTKADKDRIKDEYWGYRQTIEKMTRLQLLLAREGKVAPPKGNWEQAGSGAMDMLAGAGKGLLDAGKKGASGAAEFYGNAGTMYDYYYKKMEGSPGLRTTFAIGAPLAIAGISYGIAKLVNGAVGGGFFRKLFANVVTFLGIGWALNKFVVGPQAEKIRAEGVAASAASAAKSESEAEDLTAAPATSTAVTKPTATVSAAPAATTTTPSTSVASSPSGTASVSAEASPGSSATATSTISAPGEAPVTVTATAPKSSPAAKTSTPAESKSAPAPIIETPAPKPDVSASPTTTPPAATTAPTSNAEAAVEKPTLQSIFDKLPSGDIFGEHPKKFTVDGHKYLIANKQILIDNSPVQIKYGKLPLPIQSIVHEGSKFTLTVNTLMGPVTSPIEGRVLAEYLAQIANGTKVPYTTEDGYNITFSKGDE